jgi:hypothetical protein
VNSTFDVHGVVHHVIVRGVGGLVTVLDVLSAQEKADAGLRGHHGLDVDPGLCKRAGDASQDTGPCTRARSFTI